MEEGLVMDISGIDKQRLLFELWSRQKIAAFFTFGYGQTIPVPLFDRAAAAKAVTGYIDYFQGRAIKMDLSKDTVSVEAYERNAGQGAFAQAVEAARQFKK